MGTRKNQASLSPAEKAAFVVAVLALKNHVPSQMGLAGRYDDYVKMHQDSMDAASATAPGWAHQGPAFFPWHREYLRRFELDLQAIDPSVNLPYWDWTVDTSPTGPPSTPEFLGGNGRAGDQRVTDGAFAYAAGNWTLTVHDPAIPNPGPDLRRNFGAFPGAATLPTGAQVTAALAVVPYYIAPWRSHVDFAAGEQPVQPSFCNRLEGWYGAGSIHNRVHLWVAGGTPPAFADAGAMFWGTSPNDPAFWLHHANCDRLWAEWRRKYPAEPYRPSGVGLEVGPPGHNVSDKMQPWNQRTPADVLDHAALGYTYDTDPASTGPAAARSAHPHAGHRVPMFDLSPEDKAAHAAALGHGRHHVPMFDLSPEDKDKKGGG